MQAPVNKFRVAWLIALGLVAMSGCASIHPGIMGVPLNERGESIRNERTLHGIKVSCQLDDFLSDDRFKLLNVTVENTSLDWVNIPEVSIAFPRTDLNNLIGIPGGDDLVQWVEAATEKKRVEAENRAAFLEALLLVGAVVGAVGDASGHHGGHAIGAMGHMVELGAFAAGVANDAQQEAGEATRARLYPENHVLHGNLIVPPETFVRKYIVFQFKGAGIQKRDLFLLDFHIKDGVVETVSLPVTCGQ